MNHIKGHSVTFMTALPLNPVSILRHHYYLISLGKCLVSVQFLPLQLLTRWPVTGTGLTVKNHAFLGVSHRTLVPLVQQHLPHRHWMCKRKQTVYGNVFCQRQFETSKNSGRGGGSLDYKCYSCMEWWKTLEVERLETKWGSRDM